MRDDRHYLIRRNRKKTNQNHAKFPENDKIVYAKFIEKRKA